MSAYIGYTTLNPESAGQDTDAPSSQPGQITAIADLLGTGPLAAWLEDPQRIDGLSLQEGIRADDLPRLMQHWPQGRLFGPAADVQWERLSDGSVHVVAISDAALDSAHWQGVLPLTALDTDDQTDGMHLLLWGEYKKGRWEEGRIPGLNRRPGQEPCYPTHWQGPYAAIVACCYEARWDYQAGSMESVRTITRYLRYDGNYQPAEDRRLKQNQPEGTP